MILSTRPYGDRDCPTVQAALAGWIQQAGDCGYPHIGEIPHRIYENLRGRRPIGELVQVWEDDAAIVGLGIGLRFGSTFDVVTSPTYRGTVAETAMIEAALETTQRYIGTSEHERGSVGTDVFACDTVRAQLLIRLGFKRFRLWDQTRKRSLAASIPEPELPSGFNIRVVAESDSAQLALARNSAFDESWSGQQYRDQVMRKPGYRTERELVVVSPQGKVAAFTILWLDGVNQIGHFEPVGTHRDFQRRGLARALMLHALRELQVHGMQTATVTHAADNQPALALYSGLGFQKTCHTFGYRR